MHLDNDLYIKLTYNPQHTNDERRRSIPSGSNLTDVQSLNRRTVFDIIRLEGPISRARIGRQVSLSVPTVSNIVRSLLETGLVREAGVRRGGVGKPATELEVNPEAGFAVGLNFDRDRLVGVVVDLEGRTLMRGDASVSEPSPEEVIPKLASLHRQLIHESGVDPAKVWGTGLSVPGPLHIDGAHAMPDASFFELPGWKGVRLHEHLTPLIGTPLHVENDAVAAAIGETWWGEGRQLKNFFFIYFGLYLGGAAVVDGTVARGHSGFANEFGAVPIPVRTDDGFALSPLGVEVSIAALYRDLEEQGAPVNTLADLDQRHAAGDPLLDAWLEKTAGHLAPVIATLDCLFDPEAIIFGERFPDVLLHDLFQRLRRLLPAHAVPYKPSQVRLLRGWAGDDAAAKGAATLPLYRTLNPDVFVIETIGSRGEGGQLPTIP